MRKEGFTVVEFLVVMAIFLILAAILLPILAKARARSQRWPRGHLGSVCVNNLKQVAIIFNMYASENDGKYPPIDNTRNDFIFDANKTFPEDLIDATIIACTSDPEYDMQSNFRLRSNVAHADFSVGDVHPDCFTDMSYCYLGWLIMSDEEAEAFFAAYDNLSPEDYDRDIIVPEGKGNGGGDVIHRLERRAGRSCKNLDIDPSEIPVIWDMPSVDLLNFSHVPAGAFVLYLDGHVEWIDYPGKFPMTETMARLLDERPREPIPDCEE